MKGVVLAGGKATRLRPLTLVTNKHLLPVYNKPMIYYPLESMKAAGITEVLIVVSPSHSGSFLNLLGSGKEFGLKLTYEIQDEPNGLADALSVAQDFADNEPVLVLLGDNILFYSLEEAKQSFMKHKKGAMIFAVHHDDPRQYGVVELDGDIVVSIEEKPKNPKSNFIQIGVYMYDKTVFDRISSLKPSGRGELEITDLNNSYLHSGQLRCKKIEELWIDAGTSHDELLKANTMVAKYVNNKL